MTAPDTRRVGSIGHRAARIGLLQRAATHVGPADLAEALGIEPRSLRAKLSADRGISDTDLRSAAAAVEARADALLAQARAIRAATT